MGGLKKYKMPRMNAITGQFSHEQCKIAVATNSNNGITIWKYSLKFRE